jgi:hypothetical protein
MNLANNHQQTGRTQLPNNQLQRKNSLDLPMNWLLFNYICDYTFAKTYFFQKIEDMNDNDYQKSIIDFGYY